MTDTTSRDTILVTGATGAQGGSVARHLLREGRLRVRALTRRPGSPEADALRQAGAEVAAGDFEDAGALRDALRGCRYVFGVTNFWEHFGREEQQGTAFLDAIAASPDVEHLVFSTLATYWPEGGPKLPVPHVDIKERLEDYARGLGLSATYVHVAFYYENFLTFFPPRRQEDGTFAFGFPQGDTPLAAVAAEDVGGVVAAILRDPAAFRGGRVGVVGDDRPCAAYAADMTEVLGRPIAFQHIPREVFAGFGFPGAEDLAAMFEMNRLYVPSRAEDRAESRRLYPEMQDFRTWLTRNAARFTPLLTG